MKRVLIALCMASLLTGCGVFKGGKKKTTPTIGERIAVLSTEQTLQVDPALAGVSIVLPGAEANADWPQPGGNAAKSIGNVALPSALGRAFSVKVGEGSSNKARLASGPVVGGGRVYTMDTRGVVRALNAQTGAVQWQASFGTAGKNAAALFGGGVSFDNGRVYATNGLGYAAALDAATGAVAWTVRPGGPLRGAPTVANDNVYVVTQDNQLFALNPADGAQRWQGGGSLEIAGVFGAGAPAASQGTVVAGFSSGELNAYRYENGRGVWQDALARTSISTAVTTLSDIDASPVIDQGRVYAVGQGGRMVALELVTGQRIWEINVAGISTPAIGGDWLFVVTDDAQLLAIARATGHIKWMTQLPRWQNEEKKKGAIRWVGPVIAGDRLIVANSLGQITNVAAADGAIQTTVDTKMPISLAPAVAGGTLYILHDDGTLTAWR